MPFSDSELESLYGDLSPVGNTTAPIETQPDQAEVPFKRLNQVANILPAAGNALASSVVNIASLINADTPDNKKKLMLQNICFPLLM